MHRTACGVPILLPWQAFRRRLTHHESDPGDCRLSEVPVGRPRYRCRNRAQQGAACRRLLETARVVRTLQRSYVLPDAFGLSARAIQASFGASRRAAVAGLRFFIQRRPRWSSMNRWQVWDHRMASRCRLLGRRRRRRLCCCRCCCTSAPLQGCELLRLYGAELLAQAVPQGPSALKGRQAGGAALALALHCERGRGRSSAGTSCCCQRQQPLWSRPIRCLLTAPSPCPFLFDAASAFGSPPSRACRLCPHYGCLCVFWLCKQA